MTSMLANSAQLGKQCLTRSHEGTKERHSGECLVPCSQKLTKKVIDFYVKVKYKEIDWLLSVRGPVDKNVPGEKNGMGILSYRSIPAVLRENARKYAKKQVLPLQSNDIIFQGVAP